MLGELLQEPGVVEDLDLGSRVGFLAIHGGLEPGTAEVAQAAARGAGASYYTVQQPDDLKWHIPTHTIDPGEAPRLAAFLDHVDVVVSVHGYWRADLRMAVLVGGANRELAAELGPLLRDALPEYEIVDDLDAIPVDLRGVHPANLVNLSRGGGVQLELPHPVRAVGPYGIGDGAARFRGHGAVLVDVLAGFALRLAAQARGHPMARLAVVGGHNLLGTEFAVAARRTDVTVDGAVDGATVGVLDGGSFVVMQRHGLGDYVQPHHIDYIANMRALRELGCDRVLAIASVGSLRLEHPVGTFIAPSDFIALTSRPVTVSAGEGGHLVPAFDSGWRARVLTTWNAVRDNDPVIDGGVYWETTGPRFETPAEIRLLASFADVVGMTVASECTAACGVGLAYAPVCIVDNLANGLGAAPLTHDEFAAGTDANRTRLLRELALVLPELVT